MDGERSSRWRWAAAASVAVALVAGGCSSGDDATPVESTTTTTASDGPCGPDPDPVLLADAPATATIVDVVARPSGDLVAIGATAPPLTPLLWVRDAGGAAWRVGAPPGGAGLAPTAMAEADGEVWVIVNDTTEGGRLPRIFHSTDLVQWDEVPFLLDGAAPTVVVNALQRDGDRWLALTQDGADNRLVESTDGSSWTTQTSLQPSTEPDRDSLVLWDLRPTDAAVTSVGFTIGDVLHPLFVTWPPVGDPVEEVLREDVATDLRLWGIAPDVDAELLVADRLTRGADGLPTSLTGLVFQRSGDGPLEQVAQLSPATPFVVPADVVIVGDEAVVVGSLGETRQLLTPAVWTVCLRP